jgi:tetratricopeptide (TPR) repeat protein
MGWCQGRREIVALALVLALLPVSLLLAQEELDPYQYDEVARAQIGNARVVSGAMNLWLQATGAALGRADWSQATSLADRAWMLYRTVEDEVPETLPRYAQHGAMIKMAQAKAMAEQGDDQNAASYYRQAGELHPDPRAWTSAGQIAGRMEEWHQARRDFEKALGLPGVSPDVYLRLGEVLYQLGETERAIEMVEEGVAKGVSRDQADLYLARFRREAQVEGGYSRGGTVHFRITFEDVEEQQDFLFRVEQSLERVFERVCRFLGTYPKNRVPVVIYPSTSKYRAASAAPSWTAAVYNGKIRVPTGDLTKADDGHLDRILAHEFAHYLIERLAGKGAPAWLQEGLAQHVEADGEPPSWVPEYTRRVLRNYRDKPFPVTMKQLEGGFHGVQGDGVQAAYAVSYYAMGVLLEEAGRFRVENLMGALKRGMEPEGALKLECFMDYSQLDQKWRDFALR